ncbi:MAG TPA: filamentous hemagglutinin N-terminal domain-containing protein, partial [Solimonas sp.]|nr:filamentous hemagglutinin N-terminal domain-containing protein [Solimonas sp.]
MFTHRRHPLAAALRAMRGPLAVASAVAPALLLASPSGGQVIAGQAGIGHPTANGTVINQTSASAVINWQQFSVGSSEYVVFNQPSASAAVLNRVVGGHASEILGNLSANGRVFLVNPQGVVFGQGARVDVGGLVASTMDIRDADFMNQRYVFAGARSGSAVSNAGVITARDGGFVVLAGEQVGNSGLVQARLGTVALASGSAMTLGLDQDGLVDFHVDGKAVSQLAGIDNLGDIVADGGTVIMEARAARALIGDAVNNSGNVRARSIAEHDGAIYLNADGGDIRHDGVLDASGSGHSDGGEIRLVASNTLITSDASRIDARGGSGADGGFVELSGHQKFKADGAVQLGNGGTLLIDPNSINITDAQTCNADACYSATQIEGMLNQGADVYIIAADRITVQDFGADQTLSSSSAGGDLLFGIGSPVTGQLPGGPSFSRAAPVNAGTPGSGNIDLGGQDIDIDGAFSIFGGIGSGDLSLGGITASSIVAVADGQMSLGGSMTATNGFIDLRGIGGVLGANQALTASEDISIRAIRGRVEVGNVSSNWTPGAIDVNAIDIRARDGITTGDLSASVQSAGDSDYLYAGIFLWNNYSEDANGGFFADPGPLRGEVQTGNITLETFTLNNIGNDAETNLEIRNYANFVGTSHVGGGGITTGAITANARATGFADTGVFLQADGNISAGGIELTQGGTSTSQFSNLTAISDNGGDIALGDLSLGSGTSIDLQTADSRSDPDDHGNISIASIAGTLLNLDLDGSGSVILGTQSITAARMSIFANADLLELGNLTATAGEIQLANRGGSIRTGNLQSTSTFFAGEGSRLFGFSGVDINARDGVTTGDINVTVNAGQPDTLVTGGVRIFTNEEFDTGAQAADVLTGNINVNLRAGSQSGVSTQAQVIIANAARDVSGDSTTPQIVGGGRVTTGTITVASRGSIPDPQSCPDCGSTLARADINITADDNLTTQAISVTTVGADLLGSSLVAAGFDGGDVSLGATSMAANTSVTVIASQARNDSSNTGNVNIASLSGQYHQLTLNASGALGVNGGNLRRVAPPQGEASFTSLFGQQISLQNLTLDTSSELFEISTPGALTLANTQITGKTLRLDSGGNMTLSGTLTGDTVSMESNGAVLTSATQNLTVNAGGVEIDAQRIDVSRAVMNIGNGSVQLGLDTELLSLLEQKEPALAPAMSAPNAAFQAQDGVVIGNLNFSSSGYLFVRAPTFASGTVQVGSAPLFFNV